MTVKKIVVTHGRAGRVLTLKWLPGAALCVSKSQEPLYREYYPDNEYIVHPDEVVGLLPKRNWLYEKVGSHFSLADDVKLMQGVFQPAGVKTPRATGELAEALIDRLAEEAAELGVYLFCFSSVGNPLAYSPFAPFRLTGLVYGQAFGILGGSKLFWSESVRVAGDYWISLLNAYHHRMVLVDNRWAMTTADMFAGRGPISNIRSEATEAADNELFRRTFGEETVKQKMPSKSPLNIKVKSTAQRTLHLPF